MEPEDRGRPSALFERLKRDVAARLGPICPHMSRDDLQALIERVVTIKVKYIMREADDLFRARPPRVDASSRWPDLPP